MASSCVRGGLDWILGKKFLKSGQAWDQAAQGSGVPIPGGVQKMCRCDTSRYGLVGMVVLGWRVDFSNLWFYDSMIHSSTGISLGPRQVMQKKISESKYTRLLIDIYCLICIAQVQY